MSVLQIEHLVCSFPVPAGIAFRRKRQPVLKDVSLLVNEGEVVGMVGASGSGKSTLARCIVGLHKPDSGSIRFNGVSIFSPEGSSGRIPVEIQMVFQASSASLNPMMTVRQCVMEGLEAQKHAGTPHPEETLRDLLDTVGLPSTILNNHPTQLSGGQRQRVAIARALAAQPSFLLLDEPTSALDVITQKKLLSLLRNLRDDFRLSMLFITHDLSTALTACDRIAVLHDGIIVEDATVETIAASPRHPFTRRLFQDSLISS